MNINLFNAVFLCHFNKTVHMLGMAVNSAGRKKSHKVESTALSLAVFHSIHKCRVIEENAVLDILGNLYKHLVNDTACTDVGVTNLGITHLTVRQTNVKT